MRAPAGRHPAEVGVDNVMIETDLPHDDRWFPSAIVGAPKHLADQSVDVQRTVLQGNAEHRVGLDRPDPARS